MKIKIEFESEFFKKLAGKKLELGLIGIILCGAGFYFGFLVVNVVIGLFWNHLLFFGVIGVLGYFFRQKVLAFYRQLLNCWNGGSGGEKGR